MSDRLLRILLYLGVLFLASCATLETKPLPQPVAPGLADRITDPSLYRAGISANDAFTRRVIQSRASSEIHATILGALIFLADTQIHDRDGLYSSLYDYCHPDKHTCNNDYLVNHHGGREYRPHTLNYKKFKVRNLVGEWATTVHFLPARFGDKEGETKIVIQDSNVFSTVGVLFPLYIIDEQDLPPEQRFVAKMRSSAVNVLQKYLRGDAYNFWITRPGETSDQPKSGPFNIPVALTGPTARLATGPLNWFWRWLTGDLDVHTEPWVRQILDKEQNPYGFDAAYNIPNDADDTSSVVAAQKYHQHFQPEDGVTPNLAALGVLPRYLDLHRHKHDDRAQWKGQGETGAFLTWLKDEDLPVFMSPASGVIPRGVNNVDCVINANALFSLSVNGLADSEGYDAARRLLVRTIGEKLWKRTRCGLYYPQLMMFPYAISRAWREGRMHDDPALQGAMQVLLSDLLVMQKDDGSFPGGKDKTRDLSTALALNAIINIGAETADSLNSLDAYERALVKGVAYLVKQRQPHKVLFADTFNAGEVHDGPRYGYKWQSGLFFSSSYWDLAQWRSEHYTAAVAMEALAKFELAYDMDKAAILNGRRLRVRAWVDSVPYEGKVRGEEFAVVNSTSKRK